MMEHSLAFVQNFSFGEIAIVAFMLVLLFGAKRLPDLFGSVGRSIKEFKKSMRDTFDETNRVSVREPKGAPNVESKIKEI